MRRKLFTILFISIFSLFIAACAEEEVEEVLIAETVSQGHLHFDIPKGFLLNAEKSDETTFLYESELHEISKVIYRKLENDGSFDSIRGASTLEAIKTHNWDTYLARTNPEITHEERLELAERSVYKYIVSYNLYDAPMLHFHCYIEDGDLIHHIEYIAVEEEGYNTSFRTYFEGIHIH